MSGVNRRPRVSVEGSHGWVSVMVYTPRCYEPLDLVWAKFHTPEAEQVARNGLAEIAERLESAMGRACEDVQSVIDAARDSDVIPPPPPPRPRKQTTQEAMEAKE